MTENKEKTNSQGLRVLSLCGGVETGLYALQQLGIPIREYHTYEILPEAIAVSQYHFPFVVHHGDLYEADFEQFKGFDLLLAGTCCQSLSRVRIESKEVNNGLDGKSGIFFKAIECLRAIQPKYFMFENVIPSSDEDLKTMTECIGVEPILIDSGKFSAQSRERYYWTNIPLLPYEKSNLLFSDIADTDSEFLSRSIEQYADTIKWSKDGLSVRWDTSGKGYYSQANRAKLPNQKWNTVCANRAESKGNVWLGDNKIRLVTMSELEKLQTLPVGYTSCLKNKEKRGKGIGNGWTVDVIAHIFSGLKR